MSNNQLPIVSICCLSYNHAPFVRKALDGFLMQEPPTGVSKDEPWYEILIHDDASSDGTDEVIREYAAKYPDKIFPLYEEINQFSRGGKGRMDLYNYNRARGKYIALCEADDYWTDPKKLQRQVDFLETHQDYSVCWHRCRLWFPEQDFYKDDICDAIIPNGAEGVDIDLPTYFSRWYTQQLTMLFRRSVYDMLWRDKYKYYRDEHELYHLLKQGKGYLFTFVGGVYTKHGGGIYSSLARNIKGETSLNVARELYKVNRDEFTRQFYCDTLQWQIYENVQSLHKKIQLSWQLYRVNCNFRKFVKNIFRRK